MIQMYGEEYGWRGYLLPELTDRWGRITATAGVGIVWALFHAAFLYSAAVALEMSNPMQITVIQASAAFVFSFPFAYSYYLSYGSVLPAMILHFLWNTLNSWVFGNIYRDVDGLIAGEEVFVLSGEGVVGVVLGAIALCGFVVLFKREILLPEVKSTDG